LLHSLRDPSENLLRFLVAGVLAAEAAVFLELEPLGALALVLGGAVIATFAIDARQGDDISHNNLVIL
jgi:hypothetical protein